MTTSHSTDIVDPDDEGRIVAQLDALLERLAARAARRELTTLESSVADEWATVVARCRVALVDARGGRDERDRIIIERDDVIERLRAALAHYESWNGSCRCDTPVGELCPVESV